MTQRFTFGNIFDEATRTIVSKRRTWYNDGVGKNHDADVTNLGDSVIDRSLFVTDLTHVEFTLTGVSHGN
jgi:hypothetical protein